MLNPENNQSEIMRRESDYKPPRSLSHWLIGRPLITADAPHQTIGKAVGLAVFASDALSSTAYATQEILGVLVVVGAAAYSYVFPISIAIVLLLAIVTISYEQTIHAYPGGGGAYIVARDNLGELPAQTAGAALLMDYILTVAVSVSSGIAQIVSAYPNLFQYRVYLAVAAVLLIMLINLRGVKESGSFFAIPTYFFLMMMASMVGLGMFRYFSGTLGTVVDPPEAAILQPPYPCDSLPAAACICKWHHGPDRCGSHLERDHCLQGTAQPQCRHYFDLDVPDPGNTLPRHLLPHRAGECSFFRGGNHHLTAGPHDF